MDDALKDLWQALVPGLEEQPPATTEPGFISTGVSTASDSALRSDQSIRVVTGSRTRRLRPASSCTGTMAARRRGRRRATRGQHRWTHEQLTNRAREAPAHDCSVTAGD